MTFLISLQNYDAERFSPRPVEVWADIKPVFADRFRAEHGFELVFDDDALAVLIEQSLATDKTIRALCEEKFRDFHHGLKLLVRDGRSSTFEITREVALNPAKAISDWVVAAFRT